MLSQGLVTVKSNSQLIAEEQSAVRERIEAEERREKEVVTSLAAHIKQAWEVAFRHKEPIEQRILKNMRMLAGKYSEAKAAEIVQQGLPLIYMQIPAVKSRAAKSWIRDVLMPAGDKPWSLSQTKLPELPPQIQQALVNLVKGQAMQAMQATGQAVTPAQMREAFEILKDKAKQRLKEDGEKRIEGMSDLIEDQLSEGNWDTAFEEAISDVVDFPAGILKSPVLRKKKKLSWNAQTGKLDTEQQIQPESERVDPLNFYPAPGITEPNEGDCIEVINYSPGSLYDCIGLPGYDEEAIREVLSTHKLSGLTNWTRESLRTERYRAVGLHTSSSFEEKTIEAIQFWGEVQGSKLLEWGKSPEQVPDPEASYDIMAEMIGHHVICVRFNPDPLGDKPYSKACFENIPGSFWGNGVPDLIDDCTSVCNAAARALVANMGISSGPQVAVNNSSILAGQDLEQMYPWKIWQLDFSKGNQSSRPPIEFFQPNDNTEKLMAVFKEFSSLADEYSGIPAYSYGVGNSVGGAGKTASGLSMLMNAASKSIKNVVKQIDKGIIAPAIHRHYVFNMLTHHDQSIKGDAQVLAKGALSLVAKEQNQMRIQELLQQTGNPIDMQIIGMDGRAELLRKTFQGVDVSPDFIPNDQELMQRLQNQSVNEEQPNQ